MTVREIMVKNVGVETTRFSLQWNVGYDIATYYDFAKLKNNAKKCGFSYANAIFTKAIIYEFSLVGDGVLRFSGFTEEEAVTEFGRLTLTAIEERTSVQIHLEDMCGRQGQKTFCLSTIPSIQINPIRKKIIDNIEAHGYSVIEDSKYGLAFDAHGIRFSLMTEGSAIIINPQNEKEAIMLYHEIVGTK